MYQLVHWCLSGNYTKKRQHIHHGMVEVLMAQLLGLFRNSIVQVMFPPIYIIKSLCATLVVQVQCSQTLSYLHKVYNIV